MFMNGAQGGMITADNRDLNKPKDPLRAIGTIREPGRNAYASAASDGRRSGADH